MAINLRNMVLAGLILSLGCTIKPPEMKITSDKTALENQLLGKQERLSQDPLMVAAVWSGGTFFQDQFKIPADTSIISDRNSRRELILAQIRRQTISGDLNELKKQGYVGEKIDGTVRVMSDTIQGIDAVNNLVEAENHDRKIILEFYASSRGITSQDSLKIAGQDFAGLMARSSPSGSWIEESSGKWQRK